MIFSITRFSQRLPLTTKMILLTFLVGVAVWGVLDFFQTQKLTKILFAQQTERLEKQAQESRIRFDNFVTGYSQAAKLIVSQKSFHDYAEQKQWFALKAQPVLKYNEIPPWLPDASVLRKFVRIHYALLLDEKGNVRELYHSIPSQPPPALLQPDQLLLQLSAGQSIMTTIDGLPFVITAESLLNPDKDYQITLMLASPMNDDFLLSSQGSFITQNVIALIAEPDFRVLTSSDPHGVPIGSLLKELNDRYLVTGKSFFDNGASDLFIHFTSLISKKEYERLTKAIIALERQQRAIAGVISLLSFALLMFITTKSIKKVTQQIMEYSRNLVGHEPAAMRRGDELHILTQSFDRLMTEVVAAREALIQEKNLLTAAHLDLEQKNELIEKNKIRLEKALAKISSLIQQVANDKDFNVRFLNPNLKKCYELLECTKKGCPCYGKEALRCWQEAGTYCLTQPKGSFVSKQSDCSQCLVYLAATADPFYQIGEHFNNMMHILSQEHAELGKAYADLQAAQSQILQREKMASLGQLAAGVAHEINNPIGFVMSNLNSLNKYIERLREFIAIQTEFITSLNPLTGLDELTNARKRLKVDYLLDDATALLKESLDGATRVKVIVQNLKNFSRLDETTIIAADLNECLRSTLTILHNELKYKATLKEEYGEIPLTRCNPAELNQVFMNILMNSVQALDRKGTITVKTWLEGGYISVTISDSGCGIPEDKISKIFDPFFTTKDVGKGTGLGLSIVYDIIKKHQGEISVQSKIGSGTTFLMKIPIVGE